MARSLAKRGAKRTRENIVAHNTPYRYLPFYLRYFLYFLNEIPLVFPGETFTEGDTERERERPNTHIYTHTHAHTPLLIQVLNFAVRGGRSIRWNKERWRQRGQIIPGRQIGGSIRRFPAIPRK